MTFPNPPSTAFEKFTVKLFYHQICLQFSQKTLYNLFPNTCRLIMATKNIGHPILLNKFQIQISRMKKNN